MKNILSICGFGLFLAVTLQAQVPHFTGYGIADGLSRADVSSIYLDSRGVFWVGTNGAGLYQFQQARFTQNASLSDETGYTIRQIGEDAAGILYFLSETGLHRYDGYTIEHIAKGEEIQSFAISRSGVWWSGFDTLFLKAGSGMPLKKAFHANLLITVDPQKPDILALHEQGIFHLDGKFNILQTTRLQSTTPPLWKRYAIDADSTIWVISEDGQLLHLIDENKYALIKTDINNATDIAAGAMGSLWISGSHGASIYQPLDSSWISLDIHSPVNCLYFDRDHRLWLGSRTEGLLRYFGEQYRTWQLPEGVFVQKILPGRITEESLLYTTSGRLIPMKDPMSQFSPPVDNVTEVYLDALSRLWAMNPTSLWLYGDTAWVRMDTSSAMQGARIIDSDHAGNLWIAREQVLMRYGIQTVSSPIGIRFEMHEITGNLPQDDVIAIFTTPERRSIRVGKRSVGSIINDRYEQTHYFGYDVLSADMDSAGMVWIGSAAAGIFRMSPIRGQLPKPLSTTYPIRPLDVVFLARTPRSVIAVTNRNILRFHTDTSDLHVTKVDVMNEAIGIPYVMLQEGHTGVTDDGRLLFLAENAVAEFDLTRQDVVDNVPMIHISRILVNGRDLFETRYRALCGPFGQQLQAIAFSHTENQIGFILSGNSVEDEHLYYQWKLAGVQDTWSEPSTLNEIQFADLKPGAYVFEARVCDDAGNCGQITSPWRFTIRQAIWQQAWLWLLLVGVVLALGWFLYRQRKQRLTKTDELEKRRLEAELNALTLEQKSLQLQMNPHFIFNALQTLRSHIREDKLEDARTNLTRFAKLMRVMLEMSRSETITLEEELDFLQTYVEVEKMSHHLPVTFQLDIDQAIEPEEITLPPMLIQPLLENAIKYGGQGNEIKVGMQISKEQRLLKIVIDDNGTGFGTHPPLHKAASLEIIKNRLLHLGKGAGLETGKNPEGGARVTVRMPING